MLGGRPGAPARRGSRTLAVAGLALLLFLALRGLGWAQGAGDERVLSIGGSVTEIVYALGEGDRLVARDTTSVHPPEAEDLPDVGYMRALSPEGVLSVDPGLVIAEEGAGPPETIAILEEAAIPMVTVPDGYDRAAVSAKIEAVADALGVPEEGDALAARVDAALAEAEARAALVGEPRRVLFVLSAEGGRILASGTGTAAHGIIGLAGAENAVTAFEGYKPLTDEAVAAAAPDAILLMDRGDHATSDEALLSQPSIAATPAGEAGAVVRMDGLLLLGFGPRTPEAVTRLNEALYGVPG